MITADEFTARAERIAEANGKATERDEELYKELQALCCLTGYRVSRISTFNGATVTVCDPDGKIVMTGALTDVVGDLAAPPPDDAPFSIFTTGTPHPWLPGSIGGPFLVRFPVASPAAADAPVHIDRRSFTLLTDLAECLSDYLDELA